MFISNFQLLFLEIPTLEFIILSLSLNLSLSQSLSISLSPLAADATIDLCPDPTWQLSGSGRKPLF